MKKAINLVAMAVGGLLLVAAATEVTVRLTESGSAKIGGMAPSFGGWDLAGKAVLAFHTLLKTPAAAPLLVTFGASTCVPCRLGVPRMVALEKKHKDQFRLVLIDVEMDASKAQEFASDVGHQGPAILDKFEVIAKTYGVAVEGKLTLPRTFLINAKGRVTAIYKEEGKDLEDVIEGDLKLALAPPADAPPVTPAK